MPSLSDLKDAREEIWECLGECAEDIQDGRNAGNARYHAQRLKRDLAELDAAILEKSRRRRLSDSAASLADNAAPIWEAGDGWVDQANALLERRHRRRE